MRSSLFLLAFLPLFAITTAHGQTLASVNGTAITEAMLSDQMQNIPANLLKERGAEIRQKLIEQLVDQELLVQEAKRLNVEDDIDFKRQVKKAERILMYNYMLQRHVNDIVTEDLIQKTYEEMSSSLAQPAVHARHILVDTKAEAVKLIEELDGGADFADLAKENSTGPSAPRGGDLGWFRRADMVKPFSDTAFNLLPNAYSKEPVQTQFGWHVIKVEERNESYKPSFEELEDEIQKKLTEDAVSAFLQNLKEQAAVLYANDAKE